MRSNRRAKEEMSNNIRNHNVKWPLCELTAEKVEAEAEERRMTAGPKGEKNKINE